ncbi:MAG TPA: ATP-binding protein [Steroidobacteraceae bacterium]|nr:ATP-binding protein [Steroidobacteraceae bacterium]
MHPAPITPIATVTPIGSPAPPPSPSAQASALEPILDVLAPGVLILDAQDVIVGAGSRAAATLLRCPDLAGAHFAEVLKPLAGDKVLAAVLAALAAWRETSAQAGEEPKILEEIELRLPGPDGAVQRAYYRLEFHAAPAAAQRGRCVVVITDATALVQQARELAELRHERQAQTEILRGVLRLGRGRFVSSVQKTDAAMSQIDAILRKPAREQAAFRRKLEETLDQVDRIRREGAALKLSSLESAARSFEDALHDLRGRPKLSGGDFLPLAVKLDGLFGQFTMLRSLTRSALPQPGPADAQPITANGTQIIDAPQFIDQMRLAGSDRLPRPRAVGSLESTLTSLAELIAEEHGKKVALVCVGLESVPAGYQTTVKNVAIQLIRNAIVHGLESPIERSRAAKPPSSTLRLEFKRPPEGGFEMRFEDDGRGIDPQLVRRTAIAKGLLRPEQAAALSDRQAIKLIFKAGFTTLCPEGGGPAHGGGLTLVRRYVDEAGGTIALASESGRDTRFKISLPPIAPGGP